MADGINLHLESYCSYCSDFEPDIDKINASTLDDYPKYLTDIKCQNRYMCERIKANIAKNTINN